MIKVGFIHWIWHMYLRCNVRNRMLLSLLVKLWIDICVFCFKWLNALYICSYCSHICLQKTKTCNRNLKSVSKGRLMYESNRILACSVLVQDDAIYLSGVVWAAMKKKVIHAILVIYVVILTTFKFDIMFLNWNWMHVNVKKLFI